MSMTRTSLDNIRNILNNLLNKTDNRSGVGVSLTLEHNKIHEGKRFSIIDWTTLASGAKKNYLFTTPASIPRIHMKHRILGSYDTTFTVYEGVGFTGATAATMVRNNDRNSANTNQVIVKVDPSTIGTFGTKLLSQRAGDKTTPTGFIKRDDEFLLKENTTYLAQIESIAADNKVNFEYLWYENDY